ncbi:hypothetical protein GOP47_0010088 [Adiantum capillus-veneris]|uniref:Uncharacterized protein n=1 Tax=Adiantum capillus-veneris TaxID=13818 RepID=A0A9D4UVB6_ADICA|nr:hypothetical protein GOP47_0010088 [Adiantum capillus-veneris]
MQSPCHEPPTVQRETDQQIQQFWLLQGAPTFTKLQTPYKCRTRTELNEHWDATIGAGRPYRTPMSTGIRKQSPCPYQTQLHVHVDCPSDATRPANPSSHPLTTNRNVLQSLAKREPVPSGICSPTLKVPPEWGTPATGHSPPPKKNRNRA